MMLTQEGVVFGIVGACLLHLIWRGTTSRAFESIAQEGSCFLGNEVES